MITKLSLTDKSIKSYAIRKLTPKECFRLMGVRDDVIDTMRSSVGEAEARVGDISKRVRSVKDKSALAVSESQQYKQAGNSIVVDVLAHIYEQLWYPNGKLRDTENAKKKILTTFSGYDSQCMAADVLKEKHSDFDWECVGWSDIDKPACLMHDIVFPEYKDKALGDITKIDWNAVKESMNGKDIDLLTYSSPCFVAGTIVLTNEGFKPIELVKQGDFVITHTGNYRKVLKVGNKHADNIIKVTGMCIGDILCTPNHPFYVREMYRYGNKRCFREPQWKEAGNLNKKDYLCIPVNNSSIIPNWNGVVINYGGHDTYKSNKIADIINSEQFWYLMGRYVGDGWTINNKKNHSVLFACSDRNEEKLKSAFCSLGFNPTITDKDKSCRRYSIHSKELSEFVNRYGHYAYGKRIDIETLNLPIELLSSFLNGYTDSDGYKREENNEYRVSTVSSELAYGIVQAVAKVYHRPARLYKVPRPEKHLIEGREVNQRDYYEVVWHTDTRKQDKAFYEDGYIWYPCNGIKSTEKDDVVYNMEVDVDNSYTANGTVVHNCQDVSQAGKQMGLLEGSGTRSALLWYVADAIEALKPKYLLQENVKALVSKKFMPDFQKWIDKLDSLGYVSVWCVLNSKDYGVPQSRDRVFCLSMRKDVAFDYKFPEKIELTTGVKDILEDEVKDKYFLKDEQVYKYMTTTDTDSAVFVTFDIPHTHESAMFLKTYLTRKVNDEWGKKPTELKEYVESLKEAFYAEHVKFLENGIGVFNDEFKEEYYINMKE